DQGGAGQASMRPRLGRRGEPARASWERRTRKSFNAATARSPWRTPTAPTGLFSGPDRFNAATARSPWRTQVGFLLAKPKELVKLQCGHGSVAVENLGGRVERS